MPLNIAEQIERLKSIKGKKKVVLDRIIADPEVTMRSIAEENNWGYQTVTGYLTDIYDILGVPDDAKPNKREWLKKEYAEAYYKMDLPSEIPSEPPKTEKTPEQRLDEMLPKTPVPVERTLTVSPPAPRVQGNPAIGIVIVVGIVILVVVLINLFNYSNSRQNTIYTPLPSGLHGQYEEVTISEGVTVMATNIDNSDCGSGDSFTTKLQIENRSGLDYSVGFVFSDFGLVDSNGKSYSIVSAEFASGGYGTAIHSGYTEFISVCWSGRSPDETGVDYIEMRTSFLGGYDINFRYR